MRLNRYEHIAVDGYVNVHLMFNCLLRTLNKDPTTRSTSFLSGILRSDVEIYPCQSIALYIGHLQPVLVTRSSPPVNNSELG